MKALLLAVALILGSISGVSAQTWYATPNAYGPPKPHDIARLPVSVTFDWLAPAGWTTINGATWDAIWPRNARGAWYRMNVYSQPGIFKYPVFPYAYHCTLQGAGFRCRDLVRGIDRYVACPTSISIGSLKMWRSEYNSAWWELGLFTANMGPFGAISGPGSGRSVPFNYAAASADGKRINCQYGNPVPQGPGLHTDVWVYRWD